MTKSVADAPSGGPIDRVSTGVTGLDELIEGGIPRGRLVVVNGSTGSGRTTLGVQFVQHGITQCGEGGVFVTLEEEPADLYQDMGRYGWDLAQHVKNKKLAIVKSNIPHEVNTPLTVDALLDKMHEAVRQVDARRLVFDSLAAMGLCYENVINLRRDVLRLSALLRELGCTTLLLSQVVGDTGRRTGLGIEEYLSQGLIQLHVSHAYRGVEIRKMRGTRHDTNVHRLKMTDRGLVVTPGEHPF